MIGPVRAGPPVALGGASSAVAGSVPPPSRPVRLPFGPFPRRASLSPGSLVGREGQVQEEALQVKGHVPLKEWDKHITPAGRNIGALFVSASDGLCHDGRSEGVSSAWPPSLVHSHRCPTNSGRDGGSPTCDHVESSVQRASRGDLNNTSTGGFR